MIAVLDHECMSADDVVGWSARDCIRRTGDPVLLPDLEKHRDLKGRLVDQIMGEGKTKRVSLKTKETDRVETRAFYEVTDHPPSLKST
jgi:hypothetical protein